MARNGLIDEHDATIIGKSIGDRDNIAAGSTKPGRIQRVFAVAVLTLFLALSFYTPVLGCCRRLLIGCQEQAPASIEEQARQILAETPLIGQLWSCVGDLDCYKLISDLQMAMWTFPWFCARSIATGSTVKISGKLLRTAPSLDMLTSNV